MFGLDTFVIGGISAMLLVGLGIMATLARAYHQGAWLGGAGGMVWFFTLDTGTHWFP